MFCLECSYNLRGLERRSCPECGATFNPNDETTWSPVAFDPGHRRLGRAAAGTVIWGCLAPFMLLMFTALFIVIVMVVMIWLMKLLGAVEDWTK